MLTSELCKRSRFYHRRHFYFLSLLGASSIMWLACCKQRANTSGANLNETNGATNAVTTMPDDPKYAAEMQALLSLQFAKDLIGEIKGQGLTVAAAANAGKMPDVRQMKTSYNVAEFSVELPRLLKSSVTAMTPMDRLRAADFYGSLQPVGLDSIRMNGFAESAGKVITVKQALQQLNTSNPKFAASAGLNTQASTGNLGQQVILVPAHSDGIASLPLAYSAFTSSGDPAAAFLAAVGGQTAAGILNNGSEVSTQAAIPGQYVFGFNAAKLPTNKDLFADGQKSIPAFLYVHIPLVQSRPPNIVGSSEGAEPSGRQTNSVSGEKVELKLGEPLVVLTYLLPVGAPVPAETATKASGLIKTSAKDALARWNSQF